MVQSQDIYLAEGCPIVCCKTGLGVTNGEFLTCTKLDAILLESEEGEVAGVSTMEALRRACRLGDKPSCVKEI